MKIAILGTGMISELFVKNAKLIDSFECYAIYGRNESNVLRFKDKYNVKSFYTNYDSLLSNSNIDCVYIGLPNSLHFDHAIKAAKQHKHIIIEKPFVSNLKEYYILQEVCEQNSVKIVEVNRVLSLPNYEIIKNNLQLCNNISLVSLTYFQYSRKYDSLLKGELPNVFSSEFSGGALMDLGVYSIHLIVGLFGMPFSVNYLAKKMDNTIDLSGVLTLEYEDFIAVLMQSKTSFGPNQIIIQGDKANIISNAVASRLDMIEIQERNEEEIKLTNQTEDNFYYALLDIKKCFDDEKHYRSRKDQSENVMKVLDEARNSAGIIFLADKNY